MMGRVGGRARPRPGSPWRLWLGILGTLGLVALAFVIAVVVWSGASLASDPSALALLSVGPFGGTVESVHAFGPTGRPILLSIVEGRLTPRAKLSPGERVSIEAVVRRPGWDGWALGSTSREHLTIDAPVAQVGSRWLTVAPGSAPRVRFDQPVAAVAYEVDGRTTRRALGQPTDWVTLGSRSATGSTLVAVAPRSWERVGRPVRVTWFPASSTPMMVASPAPGAKISPTSTIELTFSKPVSEVLGSALPKLSPSTPGRWHAINSHTLVFSPSGFGAALASQLHVALPHAIAVTGPAGGSLGQTSQLSWTVPGGSTLRLQQLLAQAGYLPLEWAPSGGEVQKTPAAEVQAAVAPPAGSFSWRYASTPSALKALWSQGEANTVTKGAVMTFEREHGMTTDGVAGRQVWRALIGAAIAGRQHSGGYTYVYVHREIPETLTLWHSGKTVLSTPANTGIAGAETELGTFAVFEHIPEGTMEGTNPDGSHYHDEGIKWISYFNGGDAIHNFDRASFGTPQSLGCVELPLQAAAEVWPYTPIGTLVTIAG
jgi:peptidoglycan hydrolase-like protein with peptidoglycan-binding domain